jgi:glycosyltransferase involved in cell wall biosynthesis
MRIAINRGLDPTDYSEDSAGRIYEVIKYLATAFPQHQFIMILRKPIDEQFVFSSNVTVVARPISNTSLFWRYWRDIRLSLLLKKYNVDVCVSWDSSCSLITKVPQCLVIQDHKFLHNRFCVPKSPLRFYKRYMPDFLKTSKSIVTDSEFARLALINDYGIRGEKISTVYGAPREIFKPVPASLAEAAKNKYTGGNEYFVSAGTIHSEDDSRNLLKAFSVFKKRLKSNFKLIITDARGVKPEALSRDLKNYRHRNDVIILEKSDASDLVAVIGSAYAFVYVSSCEPLNQAVVEAMKCEVPVITTLHSAAREIANDAVLYADPKSFDNIAEKMMLLYKDENLRKELIQKGKLKASEYSLRRTANSLWQSILKAVD